MRHKHSVTEDPVKLVGLATIAAAIGATVAMLFTPKNGGQVRNGLKRRAKNAADTVRNRAPEVGDELADTAKDAKQRLQSTVDKSVSDAKTTASKAKTDGKVVKRRTSANAAKAKSPSSRSKQ